LIEIRKSKILELDRIYKIASQEHAKSFLSFKSMADCKKEFEDTSITYLSILNSSSDILGYIILFQGQSKNSIQLKRILIAEENFGIGQKALAKLEQYCLNTMGISHIFLDVYENNYKAIHIYEKFSYELFKTEVQNSRKVLYYEKSL